MDAVGTVHRARAADGTNVTSAADDMFIGALSSREGDFPELRLRLRQFLGA